MCRGVRCTVRRATARARMCARVLRARRSRRCFLVMIIYHRLRRDFYRGSRMSANPVHVAALRAGKRASFLLALLESDLLIRVAHALALVWLGRTNAADLGGHLADFLPIDALHHDLGLARSLDIYPFRNRHVHRMRETEC